MPEEIAKSLAAYVGCISGAIMMEDYREGLLEAGFGHVEIVDSGADLNAYTKVIDQAGCCSPVVVTTSPLQVIETGCCTPGSESTATLHEDLGALLSQYDINASAASVKVYAIKPRVNA